MLTAAIIEDEIDAINALSQLLRNFNTVPLKIMGTANNLDKGIKIIKAYRPDIVLLDIDMPDKRGIKIPVSIRTSSIISRDIKKMLEN